MRLCEKSRAWDIVDKNKPGYSMHEVDVYLNPGANSNEKPHRLSIRKNIAANVFEAYRFFFDDKSEHVDKFGTLAEVIAHTNREWDKRFGQGVFDNLDSVCKHEPPEMAGDCGLRLVLR